MDLKQELIHVPGYEKVIKFTEDSVGLIAIIALHNTQLGPGIGGTRIYPYNTFDEALTDVLRLSKGMTYKAGITHIGVGGSKSVIIADPATQKTPALLQAFGEAVNTFEGQYICAEDIGCTPKDVEEILKTTKYGCGVYNLRGSGNPAAFTAWGTFRAIQAVLQELDGSDSVEGRVIAIQGIGNVGRRLAEGLFWRGAKLLVSDIDHDITKRYAHAYDAKIVPPEDIIFSECDVLSPCAMGGIINPTSIPFLKCRAIAGAANNQLLNCSDADLLKQKGILYAPDFLTNSGGLINVYHELLIAGYNANKAREMTNGIYDQTLSIFEVAQQNDLSTHQAAVKLVDHRLEHSTGTHTEEFCFRFLNLSEEIQSH